MTDFDLDSYQAQFEDQRDTGALAMLADYRRLLASEWIDGRTLAEQAQRIRELEDLLAASRKVVAAVKAAKPTLKYSHHSQIESAGWLNSTVGAIYIALAELEAL